MAKYAEKNIKGSGMGNSKACRYSRRIAVLLEDDFGTPLEGEVYQMNLASKSLFGESPSDNTHTFENYVKYLGNNGKSLDWYITKLSFNEDNDNQSLLFTPVEHIKRGHYDVVTKVGNTPMVQKMITMTPYQAQTGKANSLPAPAAPAPQASTPKAVAEEIPEPTKRESKKAEVPSPAAKRDLDSVLKAWGDEE